MTHAGRPQAMRDTWQALPEGALWCLIETPNRLWYFDDHTWRPPFFNWLPDELACAYPRFSPREPFRSAYRQLLAGKMESFLRHGRGVSFMSSIWRSGMPRGSRWSAACRFGRDGAACSVCGNWRGGSNVARAWSAPWHRTVPTSTSAFSGPAWI
jgi:hypothetical protein